MTDAVRLASGEKKRKRKQDKQDKKSREVKW